jgi:transcriptional regulator with XRE-family HTH domain
MSSVGQLLSDTREQKKMSIQDVSAITKIRGYYLRALEEGRYNVFVSETHLRGFLRSYCRFLGIDENKIMALYRRERRIKEEPITGHIFTSKDKVKFVIVPKMILVPLIVLLVLGLLGYFFFQFKKVAKPPFLNVIEPQDNVVVNTNKILVKGQVEKGADLYVNSEKVKTIDNAGFFEVYVSLPISGVNKIKIQAESGFGFKSIVERTVVYEPTITPQLTISIRSVGKKAVDILLIRDGFEEQKTIEPGGEFTSSAMRECVLKTKDVSSVKLFVNNNEVKLADPGKDGFSVTKVIFEDGVVKII